MLRRDKPASVSSEAFIALVTPHEQAIWRLCYRLLGNRQDAEDAVQETMLRAWKRFDGFRGEAAVKSWLYRIAVNYCTDQLRLRSRRPVQESVEALSEQGFEPPTQEAMPERELEDSERRALVRQALDALSEEQRIPLILFAQEGMKYEDIANMLQVPSGTVKSRIARAREKLIETLHTEKRNYSAGMPSKQVKGGHRT